MLSRTLLACLALALPATAQTVSLVSVSSSGVQANGDSRAPRISADGNWVVFKSDASNLVAGDSNGVGDVFVRDLTSGSTALVSFAPGGAPANGESFSPHVSADGSVIVFHSSATNLVAGDTNARDDVFALIGGVIVRAASVQPNGHSREPIVSGDGRYVVFESLASNLVPSDTNGTWDIFRYDLQTATTLRVSVSGTGAQANGESHDAWVDGDGSVVCFASLATNLLTGDTNGSSDVFLRDVVGGQTIGATVAGNGGSDSPSISADGQWVAFRSSANNLVAGDLNGLGDVFLADPWNQQLSRVSVGPNGLEANGASSLPQISPDGLFVVFQSAASNLFAVDGNNRSDVFIHDIVKSLTWRQSGDAYNQDGNDDSFAPSVANGGTRIVFRSEASNVAPGDGNGTGDIALRAPAAMTWYVDAEVGSGGAGAPTSPFAELQQAIDHALVMTADTIEVLPGTYVGGFSMASKRLNLRGHGGATGTILSGGGVMPVLTITSEDTTPILIADLTITAGESLIGESGGGVYIDAGALAVSRCVFAGNGALGQTGSGGALASVGANISLHECDFVNNASWDSGLAVSITSAPDSVVIEDCTFRDNRAAGYSIPFGALAVEAAGPIVVYGTVFERNGHGDQPYLSASPGQGGGALLDSESRIEIHGCTFIDNIAYVGGGLQVRAPSGLIEDSEFRQNVGGYGGALYVSQYPLNLGFDLRGCVFEDNTGAGDGDGGAAIGFDGPIVIEDSLIQSGWAENGAALLDEGFYGHATLTRVVMHANTATDNYYCNCAASVSYANADFNRCVIVANSTIEEYSTQWLANGGGSISNSVIIGNKSATGAVAELGAGYTVDWCNNDMNVAGTGNFSADPMFWDSDGGDFHLLPGSPCIDTGDPLSPFDPDGSRADMGAFPFDPTYCGTPRAYCTAKTTSNGCTPSIAWTGSPHLTGGADDFFITASNIINNKNGLLFWGTDDAAIPFQGGYLCVKPPIVRTGLKNSDGNPPPNDCSGTFSHHFSQAYMAQSLMQPGTVIHAQYWFRDPGFQPPNNVGLSDAVRFVICE